ncbi:MAG: hypothetical protein K1X61_10440 [Chitinophagales bacterium]|nr:hypothetical protein [Chitinophagales bacterium]
MKQEQDQLKRLDWVLHFMAKHAVKGLEIDDAWTRILIDHPTIYLEDKVGNESYRYAMFKKLENDHYLSFNEQNDNKYWITFEGVIFSDYGMGGYEKKKEMEASEIEKQNQYTLRLIHATWFAGIAAILLLLFQVYEFLFEHQIFFVCP